MSIDRQADNAIRFYESKSRDYDDTWHSDFTKRFISFLDIQPGQHVLDLACGTGLLSFLEAEAVGPGGQVVGIDVTPGMLAIAAHKKTHGSDKYSHVSFIKGDVIHLEETEELKGRLFDVITVASALVLFPDPKAAIEQWSTYLKPGGVIALDATHPRNLVSGIVLERVARRLDLPIPYNRSWSKSESSLKNVLESAGVEVEQVVTVNNQAGYGRRSYKMEQWDDFFVENVIVKDVAKTFANNEIRRKAQGVYKEEWEKLAIDGKVEEVDAVFLGIARKPADGSRYISKAVTDEVCFKGGCRCGGVQYTSSANPSDITVCHCRACQQISGSDYLPFIDVPIAAVKFTHSSTRKILKLSTFAERTFCSDCGAPISMAFANDPKHISLTTATVDLESLTSDTTPKVARHIFLREKAPWVVLSDDGAERWGTEEFAHLFNVT
ncbi:S-adenosyl-L-methionine-dependent methyltransferase [Cucurbitaria berberidis CBS 394.84]|uniref:S-adenosyl-L-methionine-dependent methyltransferase n=1 Tax=Cucurbitaria berberidis CBS 394.84 TaxID=1168544 RepID=A0A9P4GTH7_9PLEO|nr:S-adenosyl-L-methionine-dependent methyltransferase [Cucurbitaria berberidis CBS 394.84]KAF1851206.1 S-adenosyl-L-methionine-dependent methyltransferase [Cucurbitaria berberidis CBS 394.84]